MEKRVEQVDLLTKAGKSASTIASVLGISERTVRNYRKKVMKGNVTRKQTPLRVTNEKNRLKVYIIFYILSQICPSGKRQGFFVEKEFK